jgi:hypothetical protein
MHWHTIVLGYQLPSCIQQMHEDVVVLSQLAIRLPEQRHGQYIHC